MDDVATASSKIPQEILLDDEKLLNILGYGTDCEVRRFLTAADPHHALSSVYIIHSETEEVYAKVVAGSLEHKDSFRRSDLTPFIKPVKETAIKAMYFGTQRDKESLFRVLSAPSEWTIFRSYRHMTRLYLNDVFEIVYLDSSTPDSPSLRKFGMSLQDDAFDALKWILDKVMIGHAKMPSQIMIRVESFELRREISLYLEDFLRIYPKYRTKVQFIGPEE